MNAWFNNKADAIALVQETGGWYRKACNGRGEPGYETTYDPGYVKDSPEGWRIA
jgi:hypothetical protein